MPQGSKVHRHYVTVQWGDTDPAKIVFYPNYFTWFDESTRGLFESAGLDWDTLTARYGTVGVPLVSASATFRHPAVFRDTLVVESFITTWNPTTFVVSHRVLRGATLIAEGSETRVWATPHPTDPRRLQPGRIPPEIVAAFNGEPG
jgi:4-hydroxybenzoyl-CoA thioesterase